MATQKFFIGEAIGFGWNTLKSNFGFFILLMLVLGLFFFITDIIYGLAGLLGLEKLPPHAIIPGVIIIEAITLVLWMIIGLGIIKISLNFCDNIKSKITDLFSQYRLFFRFLLATILYVVIIGLGFIFLIIPGIYLGIRFMFYDYFIVDKRAGVIESLRRSWRITQGSFWKLFLFILVITGILLLGLLCLVIGLFAAIPIVIVAFAFVYRKLLVQIEGTPIPQP